MVVSYNNLWKLMIDRKMKKQELCRLANISPTTLAKIANDGDVYVSTLERICNALGCDFSDIMQMKSDDALIER